MDSPMERRVYMINIRGRSFNLKAITIEPVLFLYMFSGFIQVVTFQALLYKKVCQENFNATVCSNLDNSTFKSQEGTVQKTSSEWILYSNIAMGVPSLFVVGFFLGPWGDRVGHKIPVIVPVVGIILTAASNLLNAVYVSAPLAYLMIGPFLNGVCGGFIAALMSLYSYVACICTDENRTVRMGILEGLTFLAGTVGTALSGVLLDKTSYVFVFALLLVTLLVALLYAVIFVDNIIPVQGETASVDQGGCKALVLTSARDVCSCVYNKRRNKNFGYLIIMVFILFCLTILVVGEIDIILIFTRHSPLSWSQTTLGLYRATESFIRGIAMVTLLPVAKRLMKLRDTTVMILGLVSRTASFVVLGVATKTAVLFIGAITGLLQGFSAAAIRSMCSAMVEPNEQAKMFSLIAMLESVGQLVGTSLFNSVYYATVDFYTGFCFLMAAVIAGFGILLAIYLHVKKAGMETYTTLDEEINGEDTEDDQQIRVQDIQIREQDEQITQGVDVLT